jgi:tetratricopeptide (TPR) repeat protein
MMASCYRSLGRLPEATGLYQQLLDVRPEDAALHATVGDLMAEQRRWTDAIALYRTALERAPQLGPTYLTLAAALSATERYREAANVMRGYTQRYPDDADGWYNLGSALDRVGRHDSAVKALRQAVKIRPNFADAYVNLGIALDHAGFSEEAINALRRAALMKPGLAPYAYNSIAISYRLQGRAEDALEAHRQAISLSDTTAALHAEMATTLFLVKRYDEAQTLLLEQRKRFGDNPQIALNLGRVYIRTGRKDEARGIIEELDRTNPAFAEELRTMMQ